MIFVDILKTSTHPKNTVYTIQVYRPLIFSVVFRQVNDYLLIKGKKTVTAKSTNQLKRDICGILKVQLRSSSSLFTKGDEK